MKKIIKKIPLLSGLLIIIAAFAVTTVFGALGYWAYNTYAFNIYGNSDAISGKLVNDPIGPDWAANIVTYIDNPPISLYLGWNWFSGTEKCGTVAIQNVQGDPYYAYKQQRASTLFLTAQPCGTTRYGLSSGKHIVTADGTNYYDTWTKTEVIP